jgi:hypothetical protein
MRPCFADFYKRRQIRKIQAQKGEKFQNQKISLGEGARRVSRANFDTG